MQDIIIHSERDFEGMRVAGKFAASVLDFIQSYVVAGASTLYLNDLCHNMIVEGGAIPAPLNYKGFPKSVCTSVNHVVCHGIPSADKILQDGDILNIDVTVIIDGWHGDTSRMFLVGESFEKGLPKTTKASHLCKTTYEAMMLGIDQIAPGKRLSDIGRAIQTHAEEQKFSVVRDYCGHGIGKTFHCAPSILHYVPKNLEAEKYDLELKEGMFFTVEPMINVGGFATILSRFDDWTVTTRDKSLSAQFEHTIGVTKNGYEIFTLSKYDAKQSVNDGTKRMEGFIK